MKLSRFGTKFTSDAGILSLMDDLGRTLAGGTELVMMGGGNPGHIAEVQDYFKHRLEDILGDHHRFQELVGIYDPPQGNLAFIESCASLLRKEFGWDVGPENICLTNGSQSGFFILFNISIRTNSLIPRHNLISYPSLKNVRPCGILSDKPPRTRTTTRTSSRLPIISSSYSFSSSSSESGSS